MNITTNEPLEIRYALNDLTRDQFEIIVLALELNPLCEPSNKRIARELHDQLMGFERR